MGFLIDTCIWVEVERGCMAPGDVASFTGDYPVYLSPVTIAEPRYGAEAAASPGLRQKPVLRIDAATGEIFGSLAAKLKVAGRGHLFRVQGVWLASQAVHHGLRRATFHRKDFKDIPGLDLTVLPTPQR